MKYIITALHPFKQLNACLQIKHGVEQLTTAGTLLLAVLRHHLILHKKQDPGHRVTHFRYCSAI